MQALPLAWDGYAILEDRCIRDCSNHFADMANLDIQHLQDADLLQLCNISEEEWQGIAGRVELNGSSRVRLRFGERAYEALLFQMNSTVANVSFGLLLRDCRPVQDDASFLELFKAVHSSTPDALMITDGEGCILHVNAAFERLTGYELKDAVGHTASLLRSHQHDDAFYDAMWEKLRLQGSWDGSIWNRRKDGETIPCHLHVVSHCDSKGNLLFYTAVLTNLADLAKSKEVLSQVLLFDPLTQLESRSGFLVHLNRKMQEMDFLKESLAVLAIDLSNFRRINTTYGHLGGDFLLKEFSQRLRDVSHQGLIFARLGSDEFLALSHQHDAELQLGVVFEVIQRLLKTPVLLNDEAIYLAVTMGVAIARKGNSAEGLVKQADAALYQAKEVKSPYVVYDGHLQEQAMRDLVLSKKLKLAIERGELEVFYQPKIDLATGRIQGMEALSRWRDENGKFIPPNIFIPLAEKNGLINRLFQVVVAKAIRDMGNHFLPLQHDLTVSINLSAHQFEIENLVQEITCQVDLEGLPHGHFEFEVTESVFIDNMEMTRHTLLQFKDEGYQLSLDDFGTGFSSLTYLNHLPFDTLKIDKSFVDPVPLEDRANAMTRSIVNLAHAINLRCVAEGVENQEQLEFLRLLGCDYCQGFYFSPPVDRTRFIALLEKQAQMVNAGERFI